MSDWERYNFERKLVRLLGLPEFRLNKPHHFGHPFVSTYQLAVAFAREYPKPVAALGKQIGGEPSDGRDSLARYLANELSRQIKAADGDYPIEGAWLSSSGLDDLHFKHDDAAKTGVPNREYGGFSLFRLKQYG
jgi:hypothetical protein